MACIDVTVGSAGRETGGLAFRCFPGLMHHLIQVMAHTVTAHLNGHDGNFFDYPAVTEKSNAVSKAVYFNAVILITGEHNAV